MFVLGWNLLRGRVGRAMVAIRDQPIAAQAMGINTALYKSLDLRRLARSTPASPARSARSRCSSSRPTASPSSCRSRLLVGIVVGGLASISGALYGALFIQFVPNIADQISKAAPWAIYGVFLIAFMYVMPTGVAGACACAGAGSRARSTAAECTSHCHERSTMQSDMRIALAAAAWRWPLRRRCAQKKYDPGATDTEIKIGQTMPYSGPASAYGTIGKVEAAYFKMINDAGRHQRPQDQLHQPRRRLQPAEDGRDGAQAGRAGRGAARCSRRSARRRNSAIHKYMNAKKVPQLFVATGATKWNDPKNFPWTMGWQPNYQTEGADLRASTS